MRTTGPGGRGEGVVARSFVLGWKSPRQKRGAYSWLLVSWLSPAWEADYEDQSAVRQWRLLLCVDWDPAPSKEVPRETSVPQSGTVTRQNWHPHLQPARAGGQHPTSPVHLPWVSGERKPAPNILGTWLPPQYRGGNGVRWESRVVASPPPPPALWCKRLASIVQWTAWLCHSVWLVF